MKTLSTYCVECDREVDARIEHRDETMHIRGQKVSYDAEVATCPVCGSVVADSRAEGRNLAAAYSAYRSANGLLSPEEIRGIRQRYGMSLRDFSRFLGFGEQTISRYEAGALQDEAHDGMIRLSANPAGASLILGIRREQLPERAISAAERFIGSQTPARLGALDLSWPPMRAYAPTRANGYRAFDWERVSAAVIVLAQRCRNLYKTKLQKAMFFLDYYCFGMTSTSLTGTEYAHASYGPVINDKDTLLFALQREGKISLTQNEWGEIVTPLVESDDVFNESELGYIDLVARFVDTFTTASEISDFSHGLSAWSETGNGEVIDYPRYADEVKKAVDARMRTELQHGHTC